MLERDERQSKWDHRFLRLAEHVSQWSLDPSTRCGSVIVDDRNRIISLGYNGLPQGIADTPERLEVRETKYKMILHAERNALIFSQRSLLNCIMYVWPFMPCSVCGSMIIQSGIQRVVAPRSDNPRWIADFTLSQEMFQEAGVELLLYDLETGNT